MYSGCIPFYLFFKAIVVNHVCFPAYFTVHTHFTPEK